MSFDMAAVTDEKGAVIAPDMYENTFAGKHMYVDDLVTDEANRSRGAGGALLQHLKKIAIARHCEN